MLSTQLNTAAEGVERTTHRGTILKLLKKALRPTTSNRRTDVRSQQLHFERGTKQGELTSTLLFNSFLPHTEKPVTEKWNGRNHRMRLVEHDHDTNGISCSQTTSSSSAVQSNTRPPCQTTSPQPERHTAFNKLPRKQKHHLQHEIKKTKNSTGSGSRYEQRDSTTRRKHQMPRTTRHVRHCRVCPSDQMRVGNTLTSHRQELTSPKYPLRDAPHDPRSEPEEDTTESDHQDFFEKEESSSNADSNVSSTERQTMIQNTNWNHGSTT